MKPQAAKLVMRHLHNKPIARQQQTGVVLILVAFLLALTFSLYALKSLNSQDLTVLKQQKTTQALAGAKKALIAWAVAHPNTPGLMPYPDRNNDGNYDGTSDCYATNKTFSTEFTLGQLPLFGNEPNCQTAKITVNSGVSGDFRDGDGERLWYEVSENLLHDYHTDTLAPDGTSPTINPSIINDSKVPWLVIKDSNGNVISDRVAAVIISAGSQLGNQDRTGGIADPKEYLDQVTVARTGDTYKNYEYPTTNKQIFIVAPNYKTIAENDTTYSKPYFFNDRMVYITIDELMEALNARAALEASNFLNQYKKMGFSYPDASNFTASRDSLGNNLNAHTSQLNRKFGMLPIDDRDYCYCESFQKCKCSFLAVKNVTMTKGSPNPNWTSSSGSCVRSGSTCTCSGAGRCSRGATNFICDVLGTCTTSQTGYNAFSYEVTNVPNFFTGFCNRDKLFPQPWNGKVTCSDVGSFSIGWFKNNFWQDFFYYQQAATPILQVGTKTGITALLVATGAPLVSEMGVNQTRPNSTIDHYLDSAENTDFDLVFDALNKRASNVYNDIPFIVAP